VTPPDFFFGGVTFFGENEPRIRNRFSLTLYFYIELAAAKSILLVIYIRAVSNGIIVCFLILFEFFINYRFEN